MSQAQGNPQIANFSRTRVLVLDPFIVTRRLLRDTFRDLGASQIETCSDIRGALDLIQQNNFNVLFTDWSSETDAPALIRKLRAPDSPNRFLPIVVVSAHNSIEDFKTARDAGAFEFMLKPFTTQVVRARLTSVINNPRRFVETRAYFGPDRRRRAVDPPGPDRRASTPSNYADRRSRAQPYQGTDRRQTRSMR
jgi:CheY-like chemotaxis protein